MKHEISEKVNIPSGISCEFSNGILQCKKNNTQLEKKILIPNVLISVKGNEIIFQCKKGNKNEYKKVKALMAHIMNLFSGLENKFVYELESCNLHFPMTLKVDGDKLIINNFLGEKTPRKANIISNVEVKVSGQKITVSSHDKESAGQTAANFEKATKIKNRDRRVFQDGIYIVSKPGREI